MTDTDTTLTGEERLRKKRNAWVRYLAIAGIASAIAGFFSGYFVELYQEGDLPLWIPVISLAVVLLGIAWFTFDYFRRVDELDLMDNLWSHMIGMYGGLLVFMGWYFLAELRLMPYPEALFVISIMLILTFAAYAIRKLGFR